MAIGSIVSGMLGPVAASLPARPGPGSWSRGGPGGSAIVAIQHPDAMERLAVAGIVASARAGGARVAFHLYYTEADVARVLNALT